MSVICAVYGHKSHEGDYSGGEYMRVQVGPTDGIGRVHATLYATCPRCGTEYRAGMVHLPKVVASGLPDLELLPSMRPQAEIVTNGGAAKAADVLAVSLEARE